ncbi:MFS transporter [Thermodesulfobacteriota bacterium]
MIKQYKVFYGWWIVGASFMIFLFNSGVVIQGFTALFEPIANEFNWSYAQVSLAASLRGFEVGILAPLLGFVVDRWGPRRLIFSGGILISIGLLILSHVNSLFDYYLAYALVGIGMSGIGSSVLFAAVANWFRRRVTMAIGIAACGVGFSGLMVPLITWLIDISDWRKATFILGLGVVIVNLPLSIVMRHKPEQYGYLPDGETITASAADDLSGRPLNVEVNVGTMQALTSRDFWHIALTFLCQFLIVSAVLTHVMPYLSSVGIARSTSSLVASVLSIGSIFGRLSFGWLGDRMDKIMVAIVGLILVSSGMIFFSFVSMERMWLLVPFIICHSIGWGGSVTIRAALIREYFGRLRFGTINGFADGIAMMGVISGSPLAGWVFDKWGAYHNIWYAFIVLGIVGAFIMGTIPRRGKSISIA